MNADCEQIRALLGEDGPAALRDLPDAQEHVAGCDGCFELLEELQGLDADLAELPAPTLDSELRQRLIWSAKSAPAAELPRPPRLRRTRAIVAVLRARPGRTVSGLVAALLLFGLFPLFVMSRMGAMAPPMSQSESTVDRFVALTLPEAPDDSVAQFGSRDAPAPPPSRDAVEGSAQRRERLQDDVDSNGLLAIISSPGFDSGGVELGPAIADLLSDADPPPTGAPGGLSAQVGVALSGRHLQPAGDAAYAVEVPTEGHDRGEDEKQDKTEEEGEDGLGWLDEDDRDVDLPALDFRTTDDGKAKRGEKAPVEQALGPVRTPAASEWIADNETTEDVHFQSSSGYWENTYVPGDPTLRRLHRRLGEADRSVLGVRGAEELLLDAASRQYSQPFDAPTDSALAVYVHGDRRGVQEGTRMRVQVGIQATERASGRRSAMNVGVVLDLRGELDDDDAAAVRALLEALSDARDPGDSMSLTVAGRPGGMVLPPGEFRYGPVTLALEDLLGDRTGADDGQPTLDLPSAFQVATRSVQAVDDPSQALGSSLVLLVTADRLVGQAARLQRLAHDSAVAGVPTSVVGVGDALDMQRLEAVALAGQGNRRLLASPAEARPLVDRELTAVSHVVARAVRLRIKLAPGVKLVRVLGSDRLNARRSDRVREAERSIDVRLSKNLGIDADRGEDEEGIQIVVPTWYSGDAHVVLLDVVVPGPGPVLEATVRYKDLVHLRNGVARSGLQVSRDPRPPGPLEHNVTRNVLAFELSEALAEASALLSQERGPEATARLREFAALVRDLQRQAPAVYDDPEVHADLAMLDEYAALIEQGGVGTIGTAAAPATEYLRDSLHYAARNKANPALHRALK